MFGRINCESIEDTDKQYQLKKIKRYRSAFTTGQINYLEKQYKKCPYIGNASRKEVANVLNISERAIKIWFQNRRMKEKKEVIRNEEEYNLDSYNNLINTVEFTNESLNNVHSSQSTNDMRCILPSNVSQNEGNIIFKYHGEKIYENKSYPYIMKVEKSKQKTMDYFKDKFINNKQMMTKHKSLKVQNLSKNNFHKICNKTGVKNHVEKNSSKEAIKSKETPKTGRKIKNVAHPMTPAYQDLPEDLSHKKSDMTVHQNLPESLTCNTGYTPLCNTQNFFTSCVSTGNILWKPVNLMAIPNSLQATSPQIQQSGIQYMQTKKINCTCDCHLKNSSGLNEGIKISQTPYVIAIPYHNN